MNEKTAAQLREAPVVYFDGDCAFCRGWISRARESLENRGIRCVPFQSSEGRERFGLSPGETPGELKVLTAHGALVGGARALLHLGEQFGWLRPLIWLAHVPGMLPLIETVYRWVARHRHGLGGPKTCAPSSHGIKSESRNRRG